MRRVIAVDPGETTGWAVGRIGGGEFQLERYGATPWKEFVLTYARTMFGEDPFEIVVYESWRLRHRNALEMAGSDFTAVQCIGGLKLCAWMTGALLSTKEPAHKPVADRQMGGTDYLPGRGGVEHHRDAIRHLCHYAINNEGITPDDVREGLAGARAD